MSSAPNTPSASVGGSANASASANANASAAAIKDAEAKSLARHASRRNIDTDGTLAPVGDAKKAEKPAKAKADKPKLAGWKHFAAGAVAGAAEVLATQPLDVVKTNMQANPGKFTGPIHCMREIVRASGPKGLYFGMGPFLWQTSMKASIRFTAFNQIKDVLEVVAGPGNSASVNMASGLLAGFVEAAVWTTPTERVKVVLQTGGAKKYGNMFNASYQIVREHGVRSLFVGIVPTSIRQASSVGVRFALYPFVKAAFPEDGGTLTNMAAGATVGALSVVLNNPVDVIKSVQQSGRLNAAGKPIGTLECARLIVSESGFAGFGRGLSARVPRVGAGQAVTFAVYEKAVEYLQKI